MTTLVAYKFRGIQDYIARGGRLIDIAGGSEAIDSLCRDAVVQVFRLTDIGTADPDDGTPVFAARQGNVLQAASGTLLLLFRDDDKADQFARLWPLLADQWAPLGRHAIHTHRFAADNPEGLEISEAVDHALRQVQSGSGLTIGNQPPACPITLRASRTGLPVVDISPGDGEAPDDRDASSARRRYLMRDRSAPDQQAGSLGLKRRFGFAPTDDLSRDTDAMARAGGSSVLAVVHADGSGFGARFKALMETHGADAVTEFAVLLRQILSEAAGQAAAQMRTVKTPPAEDGSAGDIAFRPILLGGDDVTMVMPARYGLPVAEDFLRALEEVSATRLPGFLERWPMKEDDRWRSLHAAAGIAYTHAHFPFDMALHIAEGVAGWVKRGLRKHQHRISGLAFHRALDTAESDFEIIFANQYLGAASAAQLTAAPYVTRPGVVPGAVTVDQLRDLGEIAQALPRGGWRDVARLAREPEGVAERRMQRVFDVLHDDDRTQNLGEKLKAALSGIGGLAETGWIWSTGHDDARRTPLQDVDTLLALGQFRTEPEKTERAA